MGTSNAEGKRFHLRDDYVVLLENHIWCSHHRSIHGKITNPYFSELEECERGINPCNMRGCMCSDEVDTCTEDDWHSLFVWDDE